jgi:uncharacterized membrane protein
MKSRANLFGHSLHQILIAFPIGLLSTSAIFDVLWRWTGDAKWPPIAYYVIEVGLVGGVAAAVFGLIDYLAIPSGTRARRVGAFHGIASALLLTLFLASWIARRPVVASPPPLALFFSFCGVAIIGVAGWLGGELVTRFAVGVYEGAQLDAQVDELRAETRAPGANGSGASGGTAPGGSTSAPRSQPPLVGHAK